MLSPPGLADLLTDLADVFAGLRVPRPEDLIVTKVLAGRPKDLEDIRGVLAERGAQIDLVRVRTVLEMLEQALGQSDLMPLFDAELTNWRRGGSGQR